MAAANFNFVPRSVSHKPSKTKRISRPKAPCFPNISYISQESSSTPCNSSSLRPKGEIMTGSDPSFKDSNEEVEETETGDDDIVYFSKNQRWPEVDEPACVVCGRYGEFICDLTEADVCSKECKAKNLVEMRHNGRNLVHTQNEDLPSKNFQMKTLGHNDLQNLQQRTSYRYNVHPHIASLTERQVDDLQARLNITIRGDGIARPILEFNHCGVNEQILSNLKRCGYINPTPVQMQVIPVAMTGRDLLACAQTGSGKTAAFLLPLIARVSHDIGR